MNEIIFSLILIRHIGPYESWFVEGTIIIDRSYDTLACDCFSFNKSYAILIAVKLLFDIIAKDKLTDSLNIYAGMHVIIVDEIK